MGATRQLPEPSLTDDSRTPGIHAPVMSEAIEPLPSALYQSSLQPGMADNNLPSTSLFHTAVYFLVPWSCRLMVMLLPSTVNGLPPACQIMLVASPGSPVSLVM